MARIKSIVLFFVLPLALFIASPAWAEETPVISIGKNAITTEVFQKNEAIVLPVGKSVNFRNESGKKMQIDIFYEKQQFAPMRTLIWANEERKEYSYQFKDIGKYKISEPVESGLYTTILVLSEADFKDYKDGPIWVKDDPLLLLRVKKNEKLYRKTSNDVILGMFTLVNSSKTTPITISRIGIKDNFGLGNYFTELRLMRMDKNPSIIDKHDEAVIGSKGPSTLPFVFNNYSLKAGESVSVVVVGKALDKAAGKSGQLIVSSVEAHDSKNNPRRIESLPFSLDFSLPKEFISPDEQIVTVEEQIVTVKAKSVEKNSANYIAGLSAGDALFALEFANNGSSIVNITSFELEKEGISSDKDIRVSVSYGNKQSKKFFFNREKKAVINLSTKPFRIEPHKTETAIIKVYFHSRAAGTTFSIALTDIIAKGQVRFRGDIEYFPLSTPLHAVVSAPTDLFGSGSWSASSTPANVELQPVDKKTNLYKKIKIQNGQYVDMRWQYPGAEKCYAYTSELGIDQQPKINKTIIDSPWSSKAEFPNRGEMASALRPSTSRFYGLTCQYMLGGGKVSTDQRGIVVLVGEKIKPLLFVSKQSLNEPLPIKQGGIQQKIGSISLSLYNSLSTSIVVKVSQKSLGVGTGKYEPYFSNFVLKENYTKISDVISAPNSSGGVKLSGKLALFPEESKTIDIYADVSKTAPAIKAQITLDYVYVYAGVGSDNIIGGKGLFLQKYEIKPSLIVSFTADGKQGEISVPKNKTVTLKWNLTKKGAKTCSLSAREVKTDGSMGEPDYMWMSPKNYNNAGGPFGYVVQSSIKKQYALRCNNAAGADNDIKYVIVDVTEEDWTKAEIGTRAGDNAPYILDFIANGINSNRVHLFNIDDMKSAPSKIILEWQLELNKGGDYCELKYLNPDGYYWYSGGIIASKDRKKNESVSKGSYTVSVPTDKRKYVLVCANLIKNSEGGDTMFQDIKYITVNVIDKRK